MSTKILCGFGDGLGLYLLSFSTAFTVKWIRISYKPEIVRLTPRLLLVQDCGHVRGQIWHDYGLRPMPCQLLVQRPRRQRHPDAHLWYFDRCRGDACRVLCQRFRFRRYDLPCDDLRCDDDPSRHGLSYHGLRWRSYGGQRKYSSSCQAKKSWSVYYYFEFEWRYLCSTSGEACRQ